MKLAESARKQVARKRGRPTFPVHSNSACICRGLKPLRFDDEPRLALLLLEAEAPDSWEDMGVPDSPTLNMSTTSPLSDGCLNRRYVHDSVQIHIPDGVKASFAFGMPPFAFVPGVAAPFGRPGPFPTIPLLLSCKSLRNLSTAGSVPLASSSSVSMGMECS